MIFRNLLLKKIVCFSKKRSEVNMIVNMYTYLIDQQSNNSMHLIINKQNLKKIKASVTEISKL